MSALPWMYCYLPPNSLHSKPAHNRCIPPSSPVRIFVCRRVVLPFIFTFDLPLTLHFMIQIYAERRPFLSDLDCKLDICTLYRAWLPSLHLARTAHLPLPGREQIVLAVYSSYQHFAINEDNVSKEIVFI
jgi:hypothetical protein